MYVCLLLVLRAFCFALHREDGEHAQANRPEGELPSATSPAGLGEAGLKAFTGTRLVSSPDLK
jgi:hypothetical protein